MQINRRIKLLAALLSLLLISLPAYSAWADGTETLGPPSIPIAPGSGVVAAGTGLLTQPGTIQIDVPSGAAVEQVLLYWEGQSLFNSTPGDLGNGDDTAVINGNEVTGDLIGGPVFYVNASGGTRFQTTSFRADITNLGLVGPGSNTLTVGGLDNVPSLPAIEVDGASVVVIFDDGTGTGLIDVRDGNDYAFLLRNPPQEFTETQTFNFAPDSSDRQAELIYVVGDVGVNRPNAVEISIDGGAPTVIVNPLNSNDGDEWDTYTAPVVIPAGATSITTRVSSYDDGSGDTPASLIWVFTALVAPPPFEANPAIDIEKSTNGIDADSPTGPFILVGDSVNWEYVVTNSGDVALSNVEVTDDQGVSVTCPQDTLAVGESMTCTASGTAELGQYANIGTVTGEDPDGTPVTDSDPSHYFGVGPDIDIEKTPDLQTVPSGSDVTFTIVVTNTGNVDLFNVEVTDVIAPDCDNVIGDMAIGASVTYDCTLEDVTADLTNVAVVTGDDGNGNDVTDDDDADVVVEVPTGGEGCTPGYWKQEHHFGSWVGYSPSDDYETVFGVDASFTKTLLETLKQGGGGEEALGRHAVAALLNTANSDVSYEFTEAEVIALVQEAYANGDFEGAKNTLAQENERGCPLGRDDGDDDKDCDKDRHGFDFKNFDFNKGDDCEDDDKDDDCDKYDFNFFKHGDDCKDDEDKDKDDDCKKYDFDFISFNSDKDEDCEDRDHDRDDVDRDDCDKDWHSFNGFNKSGDCEDDEDRDDDKDRDNDDDWNGDKNRDNDDDRYGKHRNDDDDDRKGPPSWVNTGWR